MLCFLNPKWAEYALYVDLFEAMCVLFLSTGCLLAGLFLIHQDGHDTFAEKYVEIGKGFSVMFVGFTIPMSIVQSTLIYIANQPTVAQACTSISVPKRVRA